MPSLVWRTSTPEPTRGDGIIWTYLKDVTRYIPLFSKNGTFILQLDNLLETGLDGQYASTCRFRSAIARLISCTGSYATCHFLRVLGGTSARAQSGRYHTRVNSCEQHWKRCIRTS